MVPTSVYDCAVLPCHLVLYMEGITVLMKGVPFLCLSLDMCVKICYYLDILSGRRNGYEKSQIQSELVLYI